MSKESLAQLTDDPKNEVPRLKYIKHTNHEEVVEAAKQGQSIKLEREGVYHTIPREDWAEIEGAKKAYKRVNESVRKSFQSDNVNVRIGNNKKENKRDFKIIVEFRYYEDGEKENIADDVLNSLRESLPSSTSESISYGKNSVEVENIPIKFEKTRLVQTDYYTKKYDDVPAGAAGTFILGTENQCTYCTPCFVYKPTETTWGWLTAGHCVNANEDERAYQPSNANNGAVGESYKARHVSGYDVAVIENDGRNTKWDVASNSTFNDYMGWPIKGHTPIDRIEELCQNSTTVYQQGRTSGRTTARVDNFDDYEVEIHRYDSQTDKGDSGGCYFEKDSNDDVYIIGVHADAVGSNPSWDARGTHIPRIEQDDPVEV
ncbi:hypothetical protein ACH9L7_16585 (plasmid) [Haloferax sp. S1W]|uniref:hypothetical protein n=1 Tax=Haloferax sp. S1W TaxID=3377110 RepID=UPI0037C54021